MYAPKLQDFMAYFKTLGNVFKSYIHVARTYDYDKYSGVSVHKNILKSIHIYIFNAIFAYLINLLIIHAVEKGDEK